MATYLQLYIPRLFRSLFRDRLGGLPLQHFIFELATKNTKMAAKFSMASGLFDSAAHAEASERLQGAADELRGLQERREAAQRAQQQREACAEDEKQRRLAAALEAKASAAASSRFVGAQNEKEGEEEVDEEDSDDELLIDPELERWEMEMKMEEETKGSREVWTG